jgi:hypothetical protein
LLSLRIPPAAKATGILLISLEIGDGCNAKVTKNTLLDNKIGIKRFQGSGQISKNVMKNNKVNIKNVTM